MGVLSYNKGLRDTKVSHVYKYFIVCGSWEINLHFIQHNACTYFLLINCLIVIQNLTFIDLAVNILNSINRRVG